MDRITHYSNSLAFTLREQVFGKLRLRAGLPLCRSLGDLENEHRYYQLLLAKAFSSELSLQVTQVIDIGCRNGSYLEGLAGFFPYSRIVGIEADPYRRYFNLYRRIDQARAYAERINHTATKAKNHPLVRPRAEIWGGDFRKYHQPVEAGLVVFTDFFPFVSSNPCLKWGLPLDFADFESLVRHAFDLGIKPRLPGGELKENELIFLSVHQGEWEAEEARRTYHSLKNSFEFQLHETRISWREWASFWPSEYDSHLFIARVGGQKSFL